MINFMEDIEMYNEAMLNAYDFITGQIDLNDIDVLIESGYDYPLPFNPLKEDGLSESILDLVIEHFENADEFEKCQKLLSIKNNICQENLEM